MTWPQDTVKQLLTRRGVGWTRIRRIVEVGSTAHGISSPDTGDDYDYTVVRVEPFDELIIGPADRQSMMIRTQPDGVRSRMGDIDLQVYTLRKFAGLAAKGNPSILAALFSPAVHHGTQHVSLFADLGEIAATKAAGAAFLGYTRQQIERWVGVRGQKNVNRPELVEAYGFDTKYAAHVIRLAHQGIEYMDTGRFTMPMAEPIRSEIVRLRTGGYPELQALQWAADSESALKAAIDRSPLPERPAVAAVNRWLVNVYDDEFGLTVDSGHV